MLADKISVAKGFQTAVNIAYDLNNDAKIRGFIPTQSSLDVIEDVLLSTAASATQRARILIGAYGRGKSHIILVLLSLLSRKDKSLFDALLAKMERNNPSLYEFAIEYISGSSRLLPVVIRGSSASLSSSFLSALQITLNDEGLSDVMPETHFQAAVSAIENWKSAFPQTYKQFVKLLPCAVDDFVLALKEYDVSTYEKFEELYPQLTAGSIFNPFLGFDIVELYESVTRSLKAKGYDGIFVVYDEFSKYLESSIANATISDIKLLQDFAEKCDRSGERQMHLLLICHKDIANYIDGGLPKEKVDGWRGVSGRFKHINLHNNYAQMYEIISDVIAKESRFWAKFRKDNQGHFEELTRRFTANRLIDVSSPNEIEFAIYGCYPLHPISTFILPRLSEKVAQNERTLFTFLSSEDRHTLTAFLASANTKFPLLTPDYLYDYFESLLRKEPYTSEAHKLYKLTTNVLQKVEENSLGAKILKTIAAIYLVEQYEKLPPIRDIIYEAFLDSVDDIKKIDEALTELIERDCIVYLRRSNGYLKLKDSSGVDIPSEISAYIEARRANLRVKDILNRSTFDSFMYPTRYNDENEITRYFDFTFIDSEEFWSVENWAKRTELEKSDADGFVYAIIPKSDSDVKKINAALAKTTDVERVIFISPNKHTEIGKLAFEYDAVRSLRAEVGEDDLLADEYDIYLDDLTEVLASYVNIFTRPENGGANYYYRGMKCSIYRRSQLSEKLSEICETVFYATPVINNETVNRNNLSGQALNSRTRLLSGLLANELAPNLGLVGTAQEVSFMRSTLIQAGVLADIEATPKVNLEPADDKIRNMLAVIRLFLSGANKQDGANFDELYSSLTKPQHGIGLKRGLIPIYIAVVLSVEKQNLVVKYRDAEVRITPDLLNDINENPEDYSVILEDWNEDKAKYLSGLESLFSEYVSDREKAYNGFAFVLLAMNRWYMNLPKYAKELSSLYDGAGKFTPIDQRRKKFINSLRQLDNNPREYLLEKVFVALGKMEVLANAVPLISEIKGEWDNAVAKLSTTLISDVKKTFALSVKKASLTSVIKEWYGALSDNTKIYLFPGNENRVLSLFVTVSNDESAFIQRLAKAVTGLRVEDWSGDTIKAFLRDLQLLKETVEDYNAQAGTSNSDSLNEYKISYKDDKGAEVTKTFGKTTYSDKARLLFRELTSSIEEMGQSITEQEKRQVLIDLLQKLC